MSTFKLRQKLIDIARLDVNRVEVTKNTAPWIAKFWPATHYPSGMKDRAPYCAAAACYWVREWLKLPDVLKALKMTPAQAEAWRCKSASVYKADDSWLNWGRKTPGVQVLPRASILHTGDIVIYKAPGYSHLEVVVDDDGGTTGPLIAIGANTDAGGSQDGEGCFEKPRLRNKVQNFIRLLP